MGMSRWVARCAALMGFFVCGTAIAGNCPIHDESGVTCTLPEAMAWARTVACTGQWTLPEWSYTGTPVIQDNGTVAVLCKLVRWYDGATYYPEVKDFTRYILPPNGAHDPITTPDATCKTCSVGVGSGEGIYTEPFFGGTGPSFDLTFSSFGGLQNARLGQQSFENPATAYPYWIHTYQSKVVVASGSPSVLAYSVRSDQSIKTFGLDGWEQTPATSGRDRITRLDDGSGGLAGWIYVRNDSTTEHYDSDGSLLSITQPNGYTISVGYTGSGSSRNIDMVVDNHGRSLQFEYNASGLLSTVTADDGASVTLTYNSLGNPAQAQFAKGSESATRIYHYDQPSRPRFLTGVDDENGVRSLDISYDDSGRVLSRSMGGTLQPSTFTYTATTTVVTVGSNSPVTYGHETIQGARQLTSTSQSCAQCATRNQWWTHDTTGFVNTVTDSAGTVTDYDYNARGLATQTIESANQTSTKRTIQTDWHPDLAVPTERRTYDAGGALVGKQTWTYNGRGQVMAASRIDPVSGATRTKTTTFCEQANVNAGTCPLVGLVLTVDGPRTDVSDTTTFSYYASDDASCSAGGACPHRKGDLWKVTNALNQVTETTEYDAAGRPLSVKDPNGVISNYEYDARGQMTARKVRGTNAASETDDAIMRFEYWPTGLIKKVTEPDGVASNYSYDAAHRLTDISDSSGNTIHFTLDASGNRTNEATKDPAGLIVRTLSRVYNQIGQIQSQTDAYQHSTGWSYDASGNPDLVTNAAQHVTDSDYDPLNRLTRTLQDVGGIAAETKFAYDAQDNLTKVTDPKALDTTYTYNGLGDLTQLQSPDTGITSYTYDSAGNRQSKTDARPVTETYAYDALNRLSAVTYATSAYNTTYLYDVVNATCPAGETFAIGRLTKMMDWSGSTQYCYDRFGNRVRKVVTTAGKIFTVRYGYNLAGKLLSMTFPDGAIVDYVRGAKGRIVEIGVTSPGKPRQVLLAQAGYAPFGPVTAWTYGNGRTLARTLNQNYQPETVQDGRAGGLSLHLNYDPVGNITAVDDGLQSQVLAQYGYDHLDRLTEVKDGPTGVPIDTYAYDATGNRLSLTNAGITTNYVFPATSHRLAQVGSTSRAYSANGNTASVGGTALQLGYTPTNRLTQVKRNGVVVMSYVYNGMGEQVRKFGTDTALTVYDEAGHWLGDYDANGVALQQVIWMDDLPVGLLTGASSAQKLHYIEPDHLGSPRVVIDPQRDVAEWKWDIRGEAFGATPPEQDVDGDQTQLVFNLRFPGQRYDAASGLNYNYFRDYDSASGRYVESDPIGLRGGISTFAYAAGNPLLFTDPFGLANTVVCTSDGGMKIELGSDDSDGVCGLSQCLAKHETCHAQDMLINPDAIAFCKNPDNARKRVFVPGTPENKIWKQQTELNGTQAELDCLQEQRRKQPLSCQSSINRQIIVITNNRADCSGNQDRCNFGP